MNLNLKEEILSFEEYTIGVMMVIMFVITAATIIFRYVGGIPIAFLGEVTTYLFACVSFLGASIACLHGVNLGMDAVVTLFPKKIQKFFVWWVVAFSIGLYGILLYQGIQLVIAQFETKLATPGTGIPNWIYSVAIPVGAVLYIVRCIQFGAKCHRRLDDKRVGGSGQGEGGLMC